MKDHLKISVITGTLGNIGDRFLTDGYKDQGPGLEEKLKKLAGIGGLGGVELCYDIDGEESDPARVKRLCDETGLVPSAVNAPLASLRKWGRGSLSASNGAVRRDAIGVAEKTIDFARAVGSPLVNLWLGQDGFDYPFQSDYAAQRDRLVGAVRGLCDYDPSMKLALEFKQREPRNRCLLDSGPSTLLLAQDVDRENLGVTVDVGHVLQNKGNMAQAVELIASRGRLFDMHMNDNYADWDDDMVVGSVHLVEFIELFYMLRKVGYDGWCAIDIFPYREDAFRATEECVEQMLAMDRTVDRLGFERLRELIAREDPLEVLRHIRRTLYA